MIKSSHVSLAVKELELTTVMASRQSFFASWYLICVTSTALITFLVADIITNSKQDNSNLLIALCFLVFATSVICSAVMNYKRQAIREKLILDSHKVIESESINPLYGL